MRMLDVGCGWGSLSLHAAEHFGAQVTGVTIAAEQKTFIDARIAERGLAGPGRDPARRTTARCPSATTSTRSARSRWASTSAPRNYPTYVEVLRRAVRPGGRVLVQQMSRQVRGRQAPRRRPVHRVVHRPRHDMRPVGETVALLEAGGLEVRDVHALREHYVLTVAGWLATFEANLRRGCASWSARRSSRVWRLYLVGGALAFRDGRMGVDQILAVRPGAAAHPPRRPRRW